MGRKLVAGVAVLALGLVLASCGGSSKPLTRAEFAKQANAICLHRKSAMVSVQAKSHGDVKTAIRMIVPEYRSDVKQLAALKPPASLRSAYREILSAERETLVIAREVLAGRPAGKDEVGAPLHRHERLRTELGMTACN